MQRLYSLAPIETAQARLLLLGSMPSAASLTKQQYYGHPRNHFWPLVCAALGEVDPVAYEARAALLLACGIALWDVIGSCLREGSLDKDIKEALPNDIPAFLRQHPFIHTVCFNGTLAKQMHDRHFHRQEGVRYLLLPSSSPVPRQIIRTMEDKLPAWLAIRDFI